MTLQTVRQLVFLSFFAFLGCWKLLDAHPLDLWDDGVEIRRVRDEPSEDSSEVLWRNQNEEQVQNVFKRFLFHYSKARNSLGALQQEVRQQQQQEQHTTNQQSHSVHPLLRLSPKLAQRRKKVLLLKIRSFPEGI